MANRVLIVLGIGVVAAIATVLLGINALGHHFYTVTGDAVITPGALRDLASRCSPWSARCRSAAPNPRCFAAACPGLFWAWRPFGGVGSVRTAPG
jgi:hypothetical protein